MLKTKFPIVEVYFILSILWGIGYPDPIRYPLYAALPGLLCCGALFYKRIYIPPLKYFLFLIISVTLTFAVSEYLYSTIYITSLEFFIISIFSFSPLLLASNMIFQRIINAAKLAVLTNSIFLIYQAISTDNLFISGVYPEPSHLGMTIGPILVFLFTIPRAKLFALLNLMVILILSPSTTLLVSIFFFSFFWKFRFKSSVKFCFISFLFLLSSLVFLGVVIFLGFDEYIDKSASLYAWTNGFSKAIKIVYDGNYYGMGPFGWIPESGEDSSSSLGLDLLNQRDLASIIPFGFASYGIMFPPFFIGLWAYLTMYSRRNQIDMILSILLLSFLATFCFRWVGVTLSPFLPLFALLLLVRSGLLERAMATKAS